MRGGCRRAAVAAARLRSAGGLGDVLRRRPPRSAAPVSGTLSYGTRGSVAIVCLFRAISEDSHPISRLFLGVFTRAYLAKLLPGGLTLNYSTPLVAAIGPSAPDAGRSQRMLGVRSGMRRGTYFSIIFLNCTHTTGTEGSHGPSGLNVISARPGCLSRTPKLPGPRGDHQHSPFPSRHAKPSLTETTPTAPRSLLSAPTRRPAR